ncbi:hypothetical protein D1872_284190 [compost metagenome]
MLIGIGDKIIIVPVPICDLFGMLNRAPELLRTCCHFTRISHQTIEVTTVDAVEFFNPVEISQILAVEHNIVTSPHQRNLVDPKVDMHVECDKKVENDTRNKHRVDDRRSQDIK